MGLGDGRVQFVDAYNGARRVASGRHEEAVWGAEFTPDGRTLVTTGDDRRVILWDVRRATVGEVLEGHSGAVHGAALSADGRTLFSASLDSRIIEWDLVGDRRLGRPFNVRSPASVPLFSLSADGSSMAVPQADARVAIVDADSLRIRRLVKVGKSGDVAGALSPDGRLLVAGGLNGYLAVYDARTGTQVGHRLAGHRGVINAVAFDATGETVASGDDQGVLRVWDVRRRTTGSGRSGSVAR